jgi:hypothetical protein
MYGGKGRKIKWCSMLKPVFISCIGSLELHCFIFIGSKKDLLAESIVNQMRERKK